MSHSGKHTLYLTERARRDMERRKKVNQFLEGLSSRETSQLTQELQRVKSPRLLSRLLSHVSGDPRYTRSRRMEKTLECHLPSSQELKHGSSV